MKTVIVKDLMVPIDEYATVTQKANLYEAVLVLEEVQLAYDPSKHKHRAILVLDNDKNVVGKLTMPDILKALEPKYEELEANGALSQTGYSPEFIKSMLKDNLLWSEPLQFICSRAFELNVCDFMQAPEVNVYIKEEATLDEAIHQMIVSCYQSLLVKKEKKVVGVLRMSDVFVKVCEVIKTCKR